MQRAVIYRTTTSRRTLKPALDTHSARAKKTCHTGERRRRGGRPIEYAQMLGRPQRTPVPFRWSSNGSAAMLAPNNELVVCFAHVAYRLHERFSLLNTGIASFAVRDADTLENRIDEADVLVISGLWHDGLLNRAKKLRLIQAIGAGTDQFPRGELVKQSIRLASARGVNYRAVAEHAMALILALSRRLPEARDNQAKRNWRGMIGDLSQREDELGGKTLLVVGLGQIGGRLAQLARAFDMRVV